LIHQSRWGDIVLHFLKPSGQPRRSSAQAHRSGVTTRWGMIIALAASLVGCQAIHLSQEQAVPKLAQALKYDAPVVAQVSSPLGQTQLNAQGTGFYQISGQPDIIINKADVVIRNGQDATLKFRSVEGNNLDYTGKVEEMDASNIKIRLASPDNANTVGIAQVNFAPNNSINTVVMTGTNNLVPFQIQFQKGTVAQSPSPTPPSAIRPTRLNAQGTGSYQISGQPDGTINEANVVIQGGKEANLKFRFVEGYDLGYKGEVEQMDASNVKIRLVSPDYANIVGIAQVNFNPDNSINTVVMTGTNNLVPFQIQFRKGAVAQLPSPSPSASPFPTPTPLPLNPAPPVNALW